MKKVVRNKVPARTPHPGTFRPDEFRVPGFKASGISCGIKKTGRKDLALILSDVPARVSGSFTTNTVKAAPVLLDMKRIKKGISRGVIINSGNANACTGRRGYKGAEQTASLVEDAMGTGGENLMVCSTGVIGVDFPIDKIRAGVPELIAGLGCDGLEDAAQAIMTTDAFPKRSIRSAEINGVAVTLAGLAKGAGMICPNMATMLAFFVTDANIAGSALDLALKRSIDRSFNSIIVDNDTSTNDTVLIFANGVSGGREIKSNTEAYREFCRILEEVAMDLAHMIVKDGEGATRFIEIRVNGASSNDDAKKAARAVAESFLVKTAFFGGDPNWGRIMAALGKSGIRMKEDRVDIGLNRVPVVKRGVDTGNEAMAAEAIKVKEVAVDIDLHVGKGSSTVWTSDLSCDYVKINSSYRT